MQISKIGFEREILAIDIKSETDFILLNKDLEFYRNEFQINVKGDYTVIDPMIGMLSNNHFLLIDRHTDSDSSSNAWIINYEGHIVNSFFADSAFRIISTKNRIVMSYSDCMLGTGSNFGNAQLVVFDFNGTCLYKYNSENKSENRIRFLENKAFLQKDDETIYFMPFIGANIDFPIIELNVMDFSTKLLFYVYDRDLRIDGEFSDIDSRIVGEFYFTAFSKNKCSWYFFENYDKTMKSKVFSRSRILELNSDKIISQIYSSSKFSLATKGLPNGVFAAIPAFSENDNLLNHIELFEM